MAQLVVEAVTDETTTAIKASDSSTKTAEEKMKNGFLDTINMMLDGAQKATEEVQKAMNIAGSYIATAYEVEKTTEMVYGILDYYKIAVTDVSHCEYLSVNERLARMNDMTRAILNIRNTFMKMNDITGMNSSGLSISEKSKTEGKMNDGERLILVRRYMKVIQDTCSQLQNIYMYSLYENKNAAIQEFLSLYKNSAMSFNFK